MAPNRMVATFAVVIAVAFVFPAASQAKEFIVGDDKGWTLNFDYVAWATGKEFHVGDTLVFNYPVGIHNVYRANLTEFQGCSMADNAIPLTSGKDTIILATPGNKWYFCGVGKHCANGQKLKLAVMPAMLMAPTPSAESPTSCANTVTGSIGFQMLIAAMIVITMWLWLDQY